MVIIVSRCANVTIQFFPYLGGVVPSFFSLQGEGERYVDNHVAKGRKVDEIEKKEGKEKEGRGLSVTLFFPTGR